MTQLLYFSCVINAGFESENLVALAIPEGNKEIIGKESYADKFARFLHDV